MCKKINHLVKEKEYWAICRKDNQPQEPMPDTIEDKFIVMVRPCVCGRVLFGRIPGGNVWEIGEILKEESDVDIRPSV